MIYRKSVQILALVLVLVLAVGCTTGTPRSTSSTPVTSTPTASTMKDAADQCIVYQTLVKTIDSIRSEGEAVLVILESTSAMGLDNPDDIEAMFSSIQEELDLQIDPQMVEDFKAKQTTNQQLDKSCFDVQGTKAFFVNDDDLAALFPKDFNSESSWSDFYAKYPGSGGVLELSSVAFNEKKDLAIVYTGIIDGPQSGQGGFILLKRNGTEWVPDEQIPLWGY